ncbi:neutral zinc metallopeptidase [Kribbella sp. NPDC003557]|uniref:neutral zinc metallopeptidase n=1 Tax=Kribbella sp. NPDC003557 TaxID=3154449 RepID=UPI0033B494D8
MPDSEEGTPKPGHFLSGDEPGPGSRPLTLKTAQPAGLGRARSTSFDESSMRRKARPLPTEPGTTSEYSGPPAAPLTGAPLPPLTGTRRVGGSRPSGWHKNPSRSGAQFTSEPPPAAPPRQYSRPVIVGLSILVVLLLTGATIGGFQLVNSYGVQRPLSQPSVKKSQAPLPIPPNPTVTVTASVVPDLVRLRQNEIYAAGKVASVSCKEPAIKPDSQSAILRYYRAMLPCLNAAWAPVLKKAKYPFRSPKVVLQTNQTTAASCTGEKNVAYYCPADESINISWKADLKDYKDDPLSARVWMIDTMAHEYGHHVQNLTEMLTAAGSREGWAKTKAEELEWSRRTELQAGCFGAAFLGANKKPLGLSGRKLEIWQWQTQHSGDEYNPKKIRDHGSRKNHWLWAEPAFKAADPKLCNTFTAAPAKVS